MKKHPKKLGDPPRERLQPMSLYPLTFDQAIDAILRAGAVKPERPLTKRRVKRPRR
jgi:hypothetical protein